MYMRTAVAAAIVAAATAFAPTPAGVAQVILILAKLKLVKSLSLLSLR